jgi:tRNA(Ile)-lysidine synthase TilS/MesJ
MTLQDNVFEELVGIPKWEIMKFAKQHAIDRQKDKTGSSFHFSALDEIMLTVIHLRHYPTDLLLAALFKTVKSTSN